ncbi:uncharacterized protein F4822DRAFT_102343 [Hypoxylon trugodes]|uniref:uncharacterized protein n=1 Tax=Hypoxylon trugodes TaxID=326681 RepID=UPI00219DFE37|nr:uncharacterized protein F4822DRAFT_102343 [Hypoxylon trugodes]KAI1382678.1 hypothetical protein F4822DRAFT_102343 [Hypoxylon trugodes]
MPGSERLGPRPDPRLGGSTSTYNRQDVISQLESFYTFLPHIPAAAVHKPPADGWPSITAETLGFQNKSPEVIELLRRLPYIDINSDPDTHPWIAPEAFPCDYRVVARKDLSSRDTPGWVLNVRHDAGFLAHNASDDDRGIGSRFEIREETWPPWVVQLTTGTDREGACYMLDTTDGTVTMYCVSKYLYDPTYAKDDPRAWRDRMCDFETRTLANQLNEWRRQYCDMILLGLPNVDRGDYPSLFVRREGDGSESFEWQETEELRSIYREHGWPDNYDKERCHRALEKWWRK